MVPGRFGCDVVRHPIDPGHLVDDARRCLAQKGVAKRIVIRRHPIDGGHGPQGAGIVICAPVAHNPDRAHGQDRYKGLPDLVVKPVLADLIDIDRIRLAQDIQTWPA